MTVPLIIALVAVGALLALVVGWAFESFHPRKQDHQDLSAAPIPSPASRLLVDTQRYLSQRRRDTAQLKREIRRDGMRARRELFSNLQSLPDDQ